MCGYTFTSRQVGYELKPVSKRDAGEKRDDKAC